MNVNHLSGYRLIVMLIMSHIGAFSLGAAIFNGVATQEATHHLWDRLWQAENAPQAISSKPNDESSLPAPKHDPIIEPVTITKPIVKHIKHH